MNVGILGGSFDPIHYAHLKMAEISLKEFNLDKIIFVPSYLPPHKSGLFASAEDRYNMIYNVIKNNSQYDIDTYEIDLKKTVYSYQMLDYFESNYKSCCIKMIIGSDSFNNLYTWKNVEYIAKKYGFIVFLRPNVKININNPYHKYCIFSKYNIKNISSTVIRQKIKDKEDILQYVPKQVFEYIKDKNLYNE